MAAPELEEVAETGCALLAKTKIPLGVIIGTILDVILEWRRQSIISESFAQFDDDDEPRDKVSTNSFV